MTLTLDKAGRVVLPKPVRDRLGLRPGTEFDLQVEADGELRLRSRRDEPVLAVVDGVLVHQGQAPADLDWNAVVEGSATGGCGTSLAACSAVGRGFSLFRAIFPSP